jgi:hypothetical protein
MGHYQQVSRDCYRLIAGTNSRTFQSYFDLCCYCRKHHITIVAY